jgi:CspA family cold shock protein
MTEEVKFGAVVFFSNKKGFGFIKEEEEGKDWFVHYSNIVAKEGTYRTLTSGQRVSFVVGTNNSGPQAEKVTVLE